MEALYPQFYRKAGLCLKRESDTKTTEILVPDPEQHLPLSHQHVTYPSSERLDEAVATMDSVTQDIYEDYMASFFQGASKNQRRFNEYRQRKYDAGILNLGMAALYFSRQLFGV